MHIELKVILDLDTIVCLIRTLLYGEIEIHATQCHLGVDGDVHSIRWIELEIELHLLLFVGGDLLQVGGSAQCTPSQLLMTL